MTPEEFELQSTVRTWVRGMQRAQDAENRAPMPETSVRIGKPPATCAKGTDTMPQSVAQVKKDSVESLFES